MDILKDGNHNVDIWCIPNDTGCKVRKREYELYLEQYDCDSISDQWVHIPNVTEEEVQMAYQSCYYVEEWQNCPHLLNSYTQVPIIEDIRRYRDRSYKGQLFHDIDQWMDGDPIFARTSAHSPKDTGVDRSAGQQGRSFTTPTDLLYTISISERCLSYIDATYYPDRNVWLAPYTNLSDTHHFRVFIHDGKIRAISQNDYLDRYSGDTISLIEKVKGMWNDIRDNVWYLDACMDIALLDNEVKIIEFNEFGASSLAGGSHYNWIQDMHTLYYSESVDIRLNS